MNELAWIKLSLALREASALNIVIFGRTYLLIVLSGCAYYVPVGINITFDWIRYSTLMVAHVDNPFIHSLTVRSCVFILPCFFLPKPQAKRCFEVCRPQMLYIGVLDVHFNLKTSVNRCGHCKWCYNIRSLVL